MENIQIKTFFVSRSSRTTGGHQVRVSTLAVRSKTKALREARKFIRECPENEDRESSIYVYKNIFKLTKNHSKLREKKCAE